MRSTIFLLSFLSALAQSTEPTYIGYIRSTTGDPDSVVYDTLDSPHNGSTASPPLDVYLNASLSVGEIDLTVSNLTVKINLDAQVLKLLTFSAGVDGDIDKVDLLIHNVSAHVLLEI